MAGPRFVSVEWSFTQSVLICGNVCSGLVASLLESSIFCTKNRSLRNLCKLYAIKAKVGLDRALKNVLTAKKGRFLGVLPGKKRFGAKEKAFYFALCHVLVVFSICKLLSVNLFPKNSASKINRAQKPTVGFCFWRVLVISRHESV